MPHYNLALIGFGNVGRALALLLLRKRRELQERYDITCSVTGIATGRHGMAVNPIGLDLTGALDLTKTGRSLELISSKPLPVNMEGFIERCGADVLFENSPVNHENGEPGLNYARLALQRGIHVVTANKGIVVHGYRELKELAAAKGLKFMHESVVMDGAPIFSLFRDSLPGAQLQSIRGVLNSTTNLVLTRMEKGESFNDGVAYAQSVGVAETDPAADIDGWDAAVKIAALVTVLMDYPLTPQQVEREGIREITPEMIKLAREQGKRYKLVCSARRQSDGVSARVHPELVPASSPMYQIEGTTSIIEFETDVLGPLAIVETDPGPHTTAYGLLADFLNIVRGNA
jgi:homoserine dehydrogenase